VELTRRVAKAVKIPVIASGGAGTKQHFADAFDAGASAALAASLFHFKQLEISDLKNFLKKKHFSIRI
jgi:cyclase